MITKALIKLNTGVYVSPHADRTEELFNLLAHQNVFPPDEIHLFVGDFNAHTQSEIEGHVLASDNTTLAKGHFPSVISCKVVNTQRTRGSRISDYNPILVHINLLDLPALFHLHREFNLVNTTEVVKPLRTMCRVLCRRCLV